MRNGHRCPRVTYSGQVTELTPENVRAFMQRDWATARRVKDESLGRWVQERGTTAAFRLAQSLLDQVWDRVNRRPSSVSGLLELTEKFARAHAQRR